MKTLATPRGSLPLPAFLPVTTFGGRFPVDELTRHYLEDFSPGIMVSHHYAQAMEERWHHPTFIDSGGFASLFEGSEIIDLGDRHGIRTREGSVLDPEEILAFQSEKADIAATLDFLITPSMSGEESMHRQELTIRNALWAAGHPQAKRVNLFASIQAWDGPSAKAFMHRLADIPFAGFALGGMVPRIAEPGQILTIVDAIRTVDSSSPLHVFGIGHPRLVKQLFDHGVDSVDSSSYVRSAVSRRYLDPVQGEYLDLHSITSPADLCGCRVCQTLDTEYLRLEGELNTMVLALHNLAATCAFLNLPTQHRHPHAGSHRKSEIHPAKEPRTRRAPA
jgi:tRNA-guanine family transglycosylase